MLKNTGIGRFDVKIKSNIKNINTNNENDIVTHAPSYNNTNDPYDDDKKGECYFSYCSS